MNTKNIVPTHLGVFDRLISVFSPKLAQKRLLQRIQYNTSVYNLSEQGYITNNSHKRSMRGWAANANSPDLDILPKNQSMRACSRDLDMNTGIVPAILDRINTNAIGLGLRLKPQIDREFLGFTGDNGKERAKKWEETTQREWETYANSIFSDAELTLNVNENAGLCLLNMLLSGDVFVALPGAKLPGQVYDLKVKVIEADFVDNPNGLMPTNKLAGGVEVNALGAPIAYHFRKPSPRAYLDYGINTYDKWQRVPRFNSVNLQQVLHLFKKRRPAQKRGVPLIAPIVEDIKQITRYKAAEVDAAILNSFFTVFVKSINNIAGPQLQQGYIPPDLEDGSIGSPIPGVSVKNEKDPRDEKIYEMGRANVMEMDENQDISLADPKHPVSGYDAFTETITQEIGASMGIPYEILIQKFNSSFSASKAALQEGWKLFLSFRKFMINHYYNPIYEMWMYEAVTKGRIDAPGFVDDPVIRASWLKCDWIGQGQGMINPSQETTAALNRIKGRISTREREYEQVIGGDWYGAMNNYKKEVDHLEDLQIKETEGNNVNNQTLPIKPNNGS